MKRNLSVFVLLLFFMGLFLFTAADRPASQDDDLEKQIQKLSVKLDRIDTRLTLLETPLSSDMKLPTPPSHSEIYKQEGNSETENVTHPHAYTSLEQRISRLEKILLTNEGWRYDLLNNERDVKMQKLDKQK